MSDALKPLRTAIVYDFDGTLAPGNIQEHRLLPEYLEIEKTEFWNRVSTEKRKHNADQILVYLRLLLEAARERGRPLTEQVLRTYAKGTPLFQGVNLNRPWLDFGRIVVQRDRFESELVHVGGLSLAWPNTERKRT